MAIVLRRTSRIRTLPTSGSRAAEIHSAIGHALADHESQFEADTGLQKVKIEVHFIQRNGLRQPQRVRFERCSEIDLVDE